MIIDFLAGRANDCKIFSRPVFYFCKIQQKMPTLQPRTKDKNKKWKYTAETSRLASSTTFS